MQNNGRYRMESVPEGEFYLFAVGLQKSIDASVYFDYENALRGGGQQIQISRNSIHGVTSLFLRPPTSFDPPLLLILPVKN